MHRPQFLTRLLVAMGAAQGLLGAPAPAHAQTADPQKVATAKALFDQAVTEMNAGQFAAACPRLEEVVKLIPDGVGAMLTLASCYEGQGRLVSAWSEYTVAQAAANAAAQSDRAKRAAAKVAQLQSRLPKLTIVVPEAVQSIPGVQITRDGTAVSPVQWGLAIPVDPGTHVVVVTAPGRKTWQEKPSVAEGATMAVNVAPLEPEAPAVESTPPTAPPPPTAAPAPVAPPPQVALSSSAPPQEAPQPRAWQRPVGLVTMGLGAVGFGVGAALGVAANNKWNDSIRATDPAYCDAQNVCGKTGMSMRSTVYDLAGGSTAAFVAGSVLVAGGAVVFLTAPRTHARVGIGPNSVWMGGTW